VPQLACWTTYLEDAGKAVIAEHLGESAMYGGAIAGAGRGTARRSRTRSSASPTRRGTSSSSSPRGWRRASCT
jgi:tRNA uridine 5-carboxymethylaminomethyl modification enzyme